MPDRDLPDPLARPVQSLANAVSLLERLDDPERDRLIQLCRSTLDALRAAMTQLHLRMTTQPPPDPDVISVFASWLHIVMGPITVIAGRAQMLLEAKDEAKRIRARTAIERGAARLMELLSQPPA